MLIDNKKKPPQYHNFATDLHSEKTAAGKFKVKPLYGSDPNARGKHLGEFRPPVYDQLTGLPPMVEKAHPDDVSKSQKDA